MAIRKFRKIRVTGRVSKTRIKQFTRRRTQRKSGFKPTKYMTQNFEPIVQRRRKLFKVNLRTGKRTRFNSKKDGSKQKAFKPGIL